MESKVTSGFMYIAYLTILYMPYIQCVIYINLIWSFFILKPNRCTNFTNLFLHETLHVLDSSSVHHQEFIHCTLSSGVCHTGL